MKLMDGGRSSPKIAGCKAGEAINVLMLHGKIETVILSDITRDGVEGFQMALKGNPLAFYPFAGILKITKYVEEQI